MEEKQESLGKRWYVIHTYSGYENKVKTNLERKVQSLGMEGKIFRIEIPMNTEVEMKDGKKHTVERKVFPGYVLIEMINDDTTWYAVRNTPGVTGFVGSGNKAIPLSEEEVRSIMGAPEEEEIRYNHDYQVGQVVRLKSGPFEDQIAKISEINESSGKLKVLVEMFGRETPVEIDFKQVEKVE